jgi:hypothetical protein
LENQRASLALDPARPSYRNGRSGCGDLLTAAKRALILAKRALTLAKRALTMPRNRRSRCRETSVHDAAKHASYHRLFSRGTWDPDRLAFWLLQRLRSRLAVGPLRLVIDDTLCPKKGPEVFGLGTHLDAVRSTRKHKVFCFGHL